MLDTLNDWKIRLKQYLQQNKILILIIVAVIISRLIFLFFPGNTFDVPEMYYMGTQLITGHNPYLSIAPYYWDSSKYPPLQFVIYSIPLLFANNILAIHSISVIFDLLCMIYVYKISKFLWGNNIAKITLGLYAFFPFVCFQSLLAQSDFAMMFFMLGSIYYYLIRKMKTSGVFLGLGIMLKYVPLLVLVPIFIELYQRNKVEKENIFKFVIKFLKYLSVVILTVFLILLPFLIWNYSSILGSILSFGTRVSDAASYAALLSIFNSIQFTFFGLFSISLYNIIQLSVFLIVMLFFLNRKKRKFTNITFLRLIIIYFALLNVFSLNFVPRNVLWFLPLIFIVEFGNIMQKKENNRKLSANKLENQDNIIEIAKNTENGIYNNSNDDPSLRPLEINQVVDFSSKKSDFVKRIWIISITMCILSIILINFAQIQFDLNAFHNPMDEIFLNWTITPQSTAFTQEYFILIISIVAIEFILYFLLFHKYLSQRAKKILVMAGVWVLNPFYYYFGFDIFYFNLKYFIGYFFQNPSHLIATIISLSIGIGINLIITYEYIKSRKKLEEINSNIIIRVFQRFKSYLVKLTQFESIKKDIIISQENINTQKSQKSQINSTNQSVSNKIEYKTLLEKNFIISWIRNRWKPIFTILGLILILRLILIFFPLNMGDLRGIYYMGISILKGQLPYRDMVVNPNFFPSDYQFHHLPLYYYLNAIPVLIAGENMAISGITFKLWYLFIEFISIFFLYKISREILEPENSRILILFYGVFPCTAFIMGFFGMQEITTSAFMLSGIYFFTKKKYIISSILLGMGFMDTIFPIFIFVLLAFYLLRKRLFKNTIFFIIGFAAVSIFISLPFLILCPTQYFSTIKYILEYDTSISFAPYFFQNLFNSTIFTVPLLNFDFKVKLLYMGVLFLFILFYPLRFNRFQGKESKKLDIHEILNSIFVFMLFSPLIFRSVHYRLIIWALPFFLLYIFSNHKIFNRNKSIIKNLILNYYILLIIVEGIFAIIWVFISADFANIGIYYHYIFIWFLIFQLLWVVIYIFSLYRERKKQRMKRTSSFSYFILYFLVYSISTYIIFNIVLQNTPIYLGYFVAPIMIILTLGWIFLIEKNQKKGAKILIKE